MGYYDGYGGDDFYEQEPSEADELIESIKEKLRGEVKTEVLEELTRLRTTNGELTAKVKNLGELEKAATMAQRDYEYKAKQAERTVKNQVAGMAANELLELMATPKFTVTSGYTKRPKCERCNAKRQLVYTTPMGRETYEMCFCSGSDHSYVTTEQMVKTMHKSRYDGLQVWYAVSSEFMNSLKKEDDYIRSTILHKPKGTVEEMESNYSEYGFDTREAAQVLADHLNSKNPREEKAPWA